MIKLCVLCAYEKKDGVPDIMYLKCKVSLYINFASVLTIVLFEDYHLIMERLCAPMTQTAMLEGAQAPGRVTHAIQIEG
jgi:hypothetical protein